MSIGSVTVIGIDCATQANKTGLAKARLDDAGLLIQEVTRGSKQLSAADVVTEWVQGADRVLLALDAPLGWPIELAASLHGHKAGDPIATTPDALFRRRTDEIIQKRHGKRPFEVGANLIARTARAALGLLEEIGKVSPVRLAWSPMCPKGIWAIEVYPAATRISLGVPAGSGSLTGLQGMAQLPAGFRSANEHERDAIVCAIAGAEFLRGNAVKPSPKERVLAIREGWIWTGRARQEHP